MPQPAQDHTGLVGSWDWAIILRVPVPNRKGDALNSWPSRILSRGKPLLRWGVLAVAMAFLAQALALHWGEVTSLRLRPGGWAFLGLAFGATLLAHIWNGWVWSWVLQSLQQPMDGRWSTLVYLRTNLWKYIPGNVWHFYGRLRALTKHSVPTGTALAGVVLDPLMMAAAALLLGLLSPTRYRLLQLLGLVGVLLALRPRWLNPLIVRLSQAKAQATQTVLETQPEGLLRYPVKPLIGEGLFVLLRGTGFILAVMALYPLKPADWPLLISRFSLAWFLGLVVPGAPGGVGVFEAAAVTLLQGQLSTGIVLGAVALYRLISTLAEAMGYGLAILAQPFDPLAKRNS